MDDAHLTVLERLYSLQHTVYGIRHLASIRGVYRDTELHFTFRALFDMPQTVI